MGISSFTLLCVLVVPPSPQIVSLPHPVDPVQGFLLRAFVIDFCPLPLYCLLYAVYLYSPALLLCVFAVSA